MNAHISLRKFERIVFFTGAGLSAESGVATYRGKGGVWGRYNYQECACQAAFERNPEKVWDFHDDRREHLAECQPNRAHQIIAEIQREKPQTRVITQNIDGLLQRAGVQNPIELHGNIWRIHCECDGTLKHNYDTPLQSRKCPCGDYWRPDIVWFGDMLDPEVLSQAEQALYDCDCIVSVGTSAVVYPAAALPKIAMDTGAAAIEINLEDTPMTPYYHTAIRDRASEALEKLWQ